MNFEIIQPDGDFKREIWRFGLDVNTGYGQIRFTYFGFQDKATRRHVWKLQSHWDAYHSRDNTMERPNIPTEIEAELRKQIADRISQFKIV